MRKTLTILIISFFLLSTSSVFIGAEEKTINEEISVSYSFASPELTKVTIGDIVYDQVILQGVPCFGDPGEPCLPMNGVYILLPENSKVTSITVIPGDKEYVGSDFYIIPGSKPVPVSKSSIAQLPTPGPVYNSNKPYPGFLFSNVGTYYWRGFQILVLTLYPVQYTPANGDVFYYPCLTVSVDTVEDNSENMYYHGNILDRQEMSKKVDNPGILDTYSEKTVGSNVLAQYDLLILTTSSLKSAFQPLKEYHDTRGVNTVIKTLNDVGGSKTADDIREYVRDAYTNWGIEYLLIGGDADLVPAKMLYVFGYDEDNLNRPYEAFMPVDMYYGCLDGPFNYDGDEKWGEPTDGEGGGDIDLYAEVYVGRACVDNEEEVNNFILKTKAYLDADAEDEYLKTAWLVGEYLGDCGVSSFGGTHLDALEDGSDRDGYTTVGIPSSEFNIGKLYDRDWPGFDPGDPWATGWPYEEIIDIINTGVHIIQHDGHSYYTNNMKLINENILGFTNTKYGFAYSGGCMAGGFDDPGGKDCFAEYFTVKTNTGGFAGIWNARYGWFWAYRTDGDGSRYARQFYDAVFGENIPIISKANQDSKEDNIFLIERATMRWTYYQLNLFGDPSVPFRVNFPEKPDKPSGPVSGKPDMVYTYETRTTDPDDDQILYLWDWGDDTRSGWEGPYNSGETMTISHKWNKIGSYLVRVKARDVHGAESEWADPLSVSLPKNKAIKPLFLQFLEHLTNKFPLLARLLQLPIFNKLLNLR